MSKSKINELKTKTRSIRKSILASYKHKKKIIEDAEAAHQTHWKSSVRLLQTRWMKEFATTQKKIKFNQTIFHDEVFDDVSEEEDDDDEEVMLNSEMLKLAVTTEFPNDVATFNSYTYYDGENEDTLESEIWLYSATHEDTISTMEKRIAEIATLVYENHTINTNINNQDICSCILVTCVKQ